MHIYEEVGGGEDFMSVQKKRQSWHGRGREHGNWSKEMQLEEGERMHRDTICSRCCVELGSEGEVRCLGCWRADWTP